MKPIEWEKVTPLLVASLQNGLNVTQACLQADISRETYYAKCKDDESFSDKMELAQQFGSMKARQNVIQAVNSGDPHMSKWYLERRDRDFKPKTDVTTGDKPMPILGGLSVPDNDSTEQDSQS